MQRNSTLKKSNARKRSHAASSNASNYTVECSTAVISLSTTSSPPAPRNKHLTRTKRNELDDVITRDISAATATAAPPNNTDVVEDTAMSENYLAEELTLRLSSLEAKRQNSRQSYERLFEQFQSIRSQMQNVQTELHALDDEIDALENQIGEISQVDGGGQYAERPIQFPDGAGDEQGRVRLLVTDEEDEEGPTAVGGKTQDAPSVLNAASKDRVHDYINMDNDKELDVPSTIENTAASGTQLPMTMNPDECLTEPTNGSYFYKHDNDQRDVETEIEDHYADEEGMEYTAYTTRRDSYHMSEDIPSDVEDELEFIDEPTTMPRNGFVLTADSNTAIGHLKTIHSGENNSNIGKITSDPVVYRSSLPEGMRRTTTSLPLNQIYKAAGQTKFTTVSSSSALNPTLDQYFTRQQQSASAPNAKTIPFSSAGTQNLGLQQQQRDSTHTASSSASIFPPALQNHFNAKPTSSSLSLLATIKRPTPQDRNQTYLQHLSTSAFPWSNLVTTTLHSIFHITSFRDHQKEIINCTMSGDDSFVIMRTGGGKSLTYQLPALLEGQGPDRKITLVISPLLSLIRDQEDQMNAFAPGSAVAFTSGQPGGAAEYNRRWALVRDRNAGVCIIFVTPEKVHKSNKLRGELEKLRDQKRLGRFVVDECHCACQWGHDFRPDYTKLGILKSHFPTVPLIAVTATASDRVREDCCKILRIGTNYQFFRSSADRPNLRYVVCQKADGKGKVEHDMALFIKEKHASHAGIVYTFSRKEADEVAGNLCDLGIVARSYHSSVSDSAKDHIHRSWMRNETQVVVATIAFGLGINKPDVRFVLHHSISKSLEAYYQESGRAGRDGEPADCVLFYSPKDVSRMLGMIHGDNGEGAFWSMVRYAQAHGNDALCRRIILSTLGEPGYQGVDVSREGCEQTEEREVGSHAKTLVQLVYHCAQNREETTLQQLVTLWRGQKPPPCVKMNPPKSDLTRDECERVVISLIISDILHPRVVYSTYSSIVYITLTEQGMRLLRSPNPKVKVIFPVRKDNAATTETPKKSKSSLKSADDGGWILKKNKTFTAKQRKHTSGKKKNAASSKKGSKPKKSQSSQQSEVIELDVSSSNDDNDGKAITKRKPRKGAASDLKIEDRDIFEDSFSDSSIECEF